MASALFNPDHKKIISTYPIAKFINLHLHLNNLPKGSLDQDIDGDVKRNFIYLLTSLASTKQATLIRLTDSLDNLATRLFRFAGALSEQATFLTTLRPYCSSLLEKVASPNASDLDIWTAVAQLLVAFDSPRVPSTPSTPAEDNSTNTEAKSLILKLHKNWNSDYLPGSLEVLQDIIRDNESGRNSVSPFYAKTLVFVQSSGMGKSRLADAFGTECPMVNFVLREEGALGYPPADKEVVSFIRKRLSVQDQRKITDSPRKEKLTSTRITEEDKKKIKSSPSSKRLKAMIAKSSRPEEVMESSLEPETENEIFLESMATTVWNHSIAVGLLQASFEICQTIASTSVSVVSRAKEIAKSLIQNRDWRHIFHNDGDSMVRLALEQSNSLDSLLKAAKKLKKNLEKFPHEDGEPLLVMVFDEASSLLNLDGSGEPDPGRYHALNRIISRLKTFPMWFFFLSTESQVGILIPANDAERTGDYSYDPSARIAPPDGLSLRRFPPFLGFQLDVEDRKRMRDLNSRTHELYKKMNEFAQPEHMAMFGRPLWFGYNPADMHRLAKLKLVGGKRGTPYNARDVHHVFAALSFRLSLDVCLQNPRTHSLARTAVNSFMRVVISMDQETGVLDTITPSEPVVAKAAMEHLCKKSNWSDSIRTLTEELLDKGLIDKGLKGELYSRFILILARDRLQTNVPPLKSVLQPQATFTVQQFLMALYGENHYPSVLLIPPKIRNAWMNFNHFVPTEENLTPKVIPELLHDLLRRSAALQLARDQPTYDKLIPIYFGNPDEPFKVSCCGVILVQDKNKDQATTPKKIFGETFTEVNPGGKSQPIPKAANPQRSIRNGSYFVFNEMTNPILFLLFDLGIIRKPKATSSLVRVSRTSGRNPDVWAIHSRGHDLTVFGCLKQMGCGDNSEKFFTSLEVEKNALYKLCRGNKVFSKLGRDFRYSEFGKVLGKRKWDDD